MTEYKIDLQQFRTSGAKVFTGRDRGEQVRQLSKIDIISEEYDQIVISVPDGIYSINPSFLEEFLINVVLKYGKEGFNRKFKFTSTGLYKISKDLNEAVNRILRTENALA